MGDWNVFTHMMGDESDETGKVWKNYNRMDADEVHTIPLNDDIDHEFEGCPCIPVIEPLKHGDKVVSGYHVIHNAWDGRPREKT